MFICISNVNKGRNTPTAPCERATGVEAGVNPVGSIPLGTQMPVETRSRIRVAVGESPASEKANGNGSSANGVHGKENGHSVADPDGVHHEYEFGGPAGTLAMMIIFPTLFYYLYVCLYFYDGKLATPSQPARLTGAGGWLHFAGTLFGLVRSLVLAFIAPGVVQQGLPVSSLGGKTLAYNCNAYASLYATIIVVAAAHYFGLFNLADIIDLYGPLLTTASITGFLLAAITYITGEKYRMSGNLIYDYFMGSTLNPRVGKVDIKMFCEIRVSWTLLFAIAMGAVARQYQTHGYISPNTALFAYGTWLYVNGCAKGEQYIPQTWDMNYEKFGWLLSYWNLSGVPFSYAYPAIYMATHDPSTYRYPTWINVLLFVVLTLAYGVFDVANGQKSWFKAARTKTFIPRNTFPQIPGTEIKDPKILETRRGPLLVSGLWGIVRKPNYTSDWVQAVIWALSAGFGSRIPYFYPVFHLTMLLHRNARDNARCSRKYGSDWLEYKRLVPYT